jgi:hypothetical protein
MTAQTMGQPPFFYYTPENQQEARQHGHFSHQPRLQQQMPLYPAVPTLPSTPVYSRPNSACSHPQAPTLYSNGPNAMTPMASPQLVGQKPTMMLETEYCDADGMYYPSTPPLSTSGSVVGSPGSCDMLQTPMNPMFSGLDGFNGGKETYESAEHLPVEWSSCGTPPITPGRCHSHRSQHR